ncbi:GntR family transcriptional regulator [Cochlodiniinecator piscidefendens]|uniref:GntR family transcriptional regulator n=1 Tax=Cochlodiniinecator piscidefendens TaxID=2715756 RepID=UPI001409ADFD|nr:GntR family transcriptional regulator [Cochlodiniinecator piscidefendens]
MTNSMISATKSMRIATTLEGEIRSGAIGKGTVLDSEKSLVKRFSVSRNTVRKGLEILASKGLITTKTGIGSFVTFDGEVIDDRAGWSVALSSNQVKLQTRLLRLTRASLQSPFASSELQGADCLIVDRLRYEVTTGKGVSLERSHMPWREDYSGIEERGLLDGSLSRTLEDLGLTIASGDEWASVLTDLPHEDAQTMGRAPGEAMLLLRRLTRAADRSVIEYVESILAPDLFGLHMEF